jgi:SNF2 family DNA or RNA helicase
MKQVTSGFINIDAKPELIAPEENPRLDLFKDVLEDVETQFIVWYQFDEELKQICDALQEAGISFVTYHGGTSRDDRAKAIDDFQAGKVAAFVAHPRAAGIGLTLTAAETVIYYSSTYDKEERDQSEDRSHRIGTVNSVIYIDLIAEDTIDEDMVRSRMQKTQVADYVIDGKPMEVA